MIRLNRKETVFKLCKDCSSITTPMRCNYLKLMEISIIGFKKTVSKMLSQHSNASNLVANVVR